MIFPKRWMRLRQYMMAGELDKAEQHLKNIQEHIGEADESAKARMWQYWGDLNYLQLHQNAAAAAMTDAGRETNQQIIHYYKQAEELDRALDSPAIRRYAQTLVSLGRGDEALAMVDKLKDQPARQRYRIIRDLIERHHNAGGDEQLKTLTPLIERFKSEIRQETDPARRQEQEIWLAQIEAQIAPRSGRSPAGHRPLAAAHPTPEPPIPTPAVSHHCTSCWPRRISEPVNLKTPSTTTTTPSSRSVPTTG